MSDPNDLQRIVELLSSIAYFENLGEPTLLSVARAVVQRAYDAGQIVFLEGEPSGGLCVVQSGWLKVFKMSPEGREQILNFLGPGEAFGAVGVFASNLNPATILALEPSTIWIIQRHVMLQLLEDYPSLAHAVIQDFAKRVQHLMQLVEDLSLRTVESRLARLLLEQAQVDTLPRQRWATQAEMAARLGTVPDVINRALRSLAQDGLIKVDRHQIQVLDKKGLEAKAGFDN